jgi:hypothetical protein
MSKCFFARLPRDESKHQESSISKSRSFGRTDIATFQAIQSFTLIRHANHKDTALTFTISKLPVLRSHH